MRGCVGVIFGTASSAILYNYRFMNKDIDPKDVKLQKYEKEYSESGLWDKIGAVAKKAGSKVIYCVLLLYYALQSPNVSITDKAKIVGALGYFILPIDMIPDFMIPLGYGDDLAVLLYLIHSLSYIDNGVKESAKKKLKEWFDNYDESEIDGI